MSSTDNQSSRHSAGAFDVRNVIAGLIGLYGVVLVLVGLFGQSAADREKTGDVNANLWAGIAMAVFALAFALWTWLRPVVVDPGADVTGDEDPAAH
ncbi:hypothetical protein [Blastococcus xanthinilyticus]|uniref:Uncharacterized protein n=1 Tax=Blastococcus xanthinilyticus TaxID=1564164 RepID=A0A5S5CTV2_9ACTN|nr:hypothetical protein [Blastococcus xanthinilyticus]TYP85982.1 hypothetical protein BD833_111126 [Blastococcus xanthinilyticus]